MEISLISPCPEVVSAFGVRALSAYLKRAGYRVRVLYIPGSHRQLSPRGEFVYRYEDELLEQVYELCKDSQIIGISFMTYFFDRAVQLTRFLKKRLDAPVIWGGIHPTVKPEEALEYADMVCIGEGEEALLEIAQRLEKGGDYSQTRNIWLRRDGKILKNPLRPLIKELDSLPFMDYDFYEHYCYDNVNGSIRRIDEEFFKKTLPLRPGLDGGFHICYRTMTDRGCPHSCSYCSVSRQREMYKGERFLRKRSVEHSIEELKQIKERYPFIQTFQFFDDTFFSRPYSDIKKFALLYKENVDMPFHVQCSPTTISEEKLECLIEAGLIYVEMGIQTGSERIKKLYNRRESNDKIVAAAKIINKYHDKLLTPDYHVILENPWETDEDVINTLNLLLNLPKPYCLKLSTLQFFPGTELYRRGKEEGLFEDEKKEIYRHPFLAPQHTYSNFLIYLATFEWMPKRVLRLLSSSLLVRTFSRKSFGVIYYISYIVLEKIRLIGKGISALIHGDFYRIYRYFRSTI